MQDHYSGLTDPAMLRLLLATLVALLGGAVGVLFGGARRQLAPLVGIAGGALLAVTLVAVLPEAAESLSWSEFAVATGSGYALFYLIGRFVYPVCPACASTTAHHEHENEHGECGLDSDHHCGCGDDHSAPAATASTPIARGVRNTSFLLALVLTLHSMVDGLAVMGGDAAHHGHGVATSVSALAMLLAVSLHKMPEGLALAALLLSAGNRPWRAFALTAAVEATTLIGGLLGAQLLSGAPPAYLGMTMAHIGGSFLYLVCHGLFGGIFTSAGQSIGLRRLAPPFAYGVLGFTCVALLLWTLGAGHHHG